MASGRNLALAFLVPVILLAAGNQQSGKNGGNLAPGKDGAFEHDLHLEEAETGGKLRVKSKGKMSPIVDLDKISSVKRVLCKGSKILVALKKDEPDVKWSRGQVIIGSQVWGCARNTLKPEASNIYAKIAQVKRPKKYIMEVHTERAGPLDMIEDASFKVEYKQGESAGAGAGRHKRWASNPLRKSLNYIDYNASFSSNIPFNLDDTGAADRRVNVYKESGPFFPAADTDDNVTYAGKDFLFTCYSCHGYSDINYQFELRIYNKNNSAEVQNYNMHLELTTHIQHNYSLYTDKEVTLTKWGTLWQTPPTNIFRTKLASVEQFPDIMMSVDFMDQANLFLTSSTQNEARYNGDFTLTGKTVISQSYEIYQPVQNDISSYDWSVTTGDQSVDTNTSMNASFSVHQNITFLPQIYWPLKDVDMNLGPPIKVSIRPRVNVVSTTDTVSRCDASSISVDSNVSVAETDFKMDAWGARIWDEKIMKSIAKKTKLLNRPLMKRCHADCHVASSLADNENVTMEDACGVPSGTILRGDSRYNELHQLWGDYVLFASNASRPSWCSSQGHACPDCTAHAASASLADACAERVVHHNLAASMSRLAKLVNAEWPNRKLVVRQMWDEPTSDHPNGRYGDLSVYNEARATQVEISQPITDPASYAVESSPLILQRLGELGTCANFKHVRTEGVGAAMCVEKTVKSSKKKRSLLSRKRRSGHVQHDMVREILEDVDTAVQEAMADGSLADPDPLLSGDSFPPGSTMEQMCGEASGRITQDDVPRFKRLVEFPLQTLGFGPEGPAGAWCGVETRACRQACSSPAADLDDTWAWCMSRTMNMRLAIRLQRLATLTAGQVFVERALSINQADGFSELYMEGRAATLKLDPASTMTMSEFTSKAVLAGFDHVQYSSPDYIEVCVSPQDGVQANVVQLPVANLIAVPLPLGEELEFDFPAAIVNESRKPMLFDKSTSANIISQHFKLSHFQSPGKRYMRLDTVLVDLLELTFDHFDDGFYVIPGSGYRPRSVNMDNIDTRHPKEIFRYELGQAVELKPNTPVSEDKLFELGMELIKAARSVRTDRIGVGFGCKMDRLYFDIWPMAEEDSEAIDVWDSGSPGLYQRLNNIADMIARGGTVVGAMSDPVICSTPKLGEDHYYFDFDLDEEGHCWADSGAEFCGKTTEARRNESIVLQRRLVSAAGGPKVLPPPLIRTAVDGCVVDVCGGCPSAGKTWENKVIACAHMILTYLSHASVPFSPLKDTVSFFNTDNPQSSAHAQACRRNRVCVEKTNIYGLLLSLTTARFAEDNVEELLFGGADNPSPLLEIVEQELAWRAEGGVEVYLENATDVNTLRAVIKILMVYNTKVTAITFHLDPDADEQEVGTQLQRKVDAWAAEVCPSRARHVTTPYTFTTYHHSVKRRSLEQSQGRNRVTMEMRNWEVDWMLKS